MTRRRKASKPRQVEALTHGGVKRRNVPTAEAQPLMADEDKAPVRLAYERRNRDLDPQLVWRGKDPDEADLIIQAPPLYIQEKVHPKVLIDDLLRDSKRRRAEAAEDAPDLFADFNGLPEGAARTEYYRHDANWSNRMILGDALQVMGSLAEREGLRGKVQCIYIDPPYGIKFNSNFQWSTTSRDVKDGKAAHVTREPEQVKAFRDTWRDGIHSYLSYLRDRLTVARDLLAESGSVFVQIGDENVHRVRAVMDEVFGEGNFVREIFFTKTGSLESNFVGRTGDRIVWFARNIETCKFRPLFEEKQHDKFYKNVETEPYSYRPIADKETALPPSGIEGRIFQYVSLESTGQANIDTPFEFEGKVFRPKQTRHWQVSYPDGMARLALSGRISVQGNKLRYRLYIDDYPARRIGDVWTDTSGFAADQIYVVETRPKVIQRCLLMTTDPGDLVLDPTCGSGTTATVAEQWGRRWITIDTSRVALALARARIMGARYPFYLLADSPEGRKKEAALTGRAPSEAPTGGDVRQGFVYERVPHVTLKSIANNAEIDAIWEKWGETLEPLRSRLSVASGQSSVVSGQSSVASGGEDDRPPATGNRLLQEHQIPRERPDGWPPETDALLAAWWDARIARQREIDAAIAAHADTEYLYDKPYADAGRVRVAGPFTVESLAPHRMLAVDENDEVFHALTDDGPGYGEAPDFAAMVLENLKTAGVQQAHREDRIAFAALAPWPGRYVCAEGRYREGGGEGARERRAGVFIGPEFGTVQRPDLVAAAREAAEAGFDVLIACAFSYEAHATEFEKLGRVPVLKARMNADLHMAGDLKNTGKGNLFVVFGEPDVEVASEQWLVAGNGKMIARYEHVKELSGLGSLEEINGAGGRGLSDLCRVAGAGAVRSDRSGASRNGVHPGEHRGGSGATRNARVSPVSGDSERLSGGNGDPSDSGPEAGDVSARTDFTASGTGRGDRTDAQRSQAIIAIEALNDDDFPLSLTTGHWSQVTIHGVDVFHPGTGEVRSDGPEGIACWFVDTDYDEESFFVRHAYFLGANDPYKALKTTLKAEIDPDAWATLNSATSRPFPRPASGRIAVKVINHLGDEAMKVFRV